MFEKRRGLSLVSVIMSVYNGAGYLSEAVESILGQSYRALEFIIIDDHSTDATPVLLESYWRSDPRVRIFRNSANKGLTKSLNTALNLSRGHFIARQDADDFSHPDRISRQMERLSADPGLALLGTGALLVNGTGESVKALRVNTGERLKSGLPRNNQFIHGSILMRRDAVESAGGYREEFRYAQDYDLFLRLSENYNVDNLDDPLYYSRLIDGSISFSRAGEQQLSAMITRKAHQRRAKGDAAWSPEIYDELREELAGLFAKRRIRGRAHTDRARCMLLNGRKGEAIREYMMAAASMPSVSSVCNLAKALKGMVSEEDARKAG